MWYLPENIDTLKTGDIILAQSAIPFFAHYGVIFYKNGMAFVAHNPYKQNPKIESLTEFTKTRQIYKVFRDEITENLTDEQIETRTKNLQEYEWSMVNNCESFVRNITGANIGIDDRVGIVTMVIVIVVIILVVVIYGRKRIG